MPPPTHESPWTSDEVRVFRNTVRQFIRRDLVPQQARWREQHHADTEAWTMAGGIGMLLPDVSQDYGGGGGTFAQ